MMNLSNLIKYKNDILKAEIVSLFSLLEKTFTEWWKKRDFFKEYSDLYTNIDIDNEVSAILKSSFKNIKLNFNIKYGSNTTNGLNAWDNFLNNKWRSWRNIKLKNSPDKFLQVLYGCCEGINSGMEKGSPYENNQISEFSDKPFLSTSFGKIDKVIDNKELNKLRNTLFKENLEEILNDDLKNIIKDDDLSKNISDILNDLSVENLSFDILESLRRKIYNLIYLLYKNIPSDSRFPANDTSLFDQAYMSTSLFKAALSGIILQVDNNDSIDITDFEHSKIKWSILGIQYDKLGLAEKGLKAASIQWYRDISKKVDNVIKNLIEIEYPLGNEVYRDETGIYFVVAENIIGKKEIDFYKLHSDLSNIKSEIQKIFTNEFEREVFPAIFLTEPSRGLMNLGHLIEKAKENFLKVEIPKNFKNKLESQFDNNPTGICQICKMRLANKYGEDNLICDVCTYRAEGRVKEWLNNFTDETIWLDELQDKNGRVALITLKFELDKWINGDLVNSLLNQKINFPINYDCYNINVLIYNILEALKNNKKINDTCLKNFHTNIPNLKLQQIAEKWFLERSIGSKWEEFIKNSLSDSSAIDFANRKIQWSKLNGNEIDFLSTLIFQFLIRKNPSPARLRRIWETTKEFFVDMESRILDLAKIPEERRKRLVWDNVDIEDGEYQDGDILFWAKNKTVYLITSIEKIKNKENFKLIKLKKYEEQTLNENSNEISLKKADGKEQSYKPYFTILSPTPISWQFIIPAEYVPDLIKKIQEEYYKNFKWVYGKLPLHIGVVIQNYKRPLYVGIKALRKIRRDKQNCEDLRITLPVKDFKARQKKAFHYQEIPEQTDKCENFYSLFERADDKNKKYEFYLYPDKNKIWIDTTQNATDTDKFYFYPNTFDFEFLDTNTRRNDIFYKNGKRLMKLKQQRPYDLYTWQYFEKFSEYFSEKKSSSKLQKLISLIYSKLEDWGNYNLEALKQFMISAFVNVLELKNNENKNEFAKILGCNDFEELKNMDNENFKSKLIMLIDMFNFWHTSLKFETFKEEK